MIGPTIISIIDSMAIAKPSIQKIKQSFKHYALTGWKLITSNGAALVLSGSAFVYVIATGGTGLVMISAVASLVAVITKFAIDFYVFKSEYKLHNTYNALKNFENNIVEYHNALKKHKTLYAELEKFILPAIGNKSLKGNKSLATFSIITGLNAAILNVSNGTRGLTVATNIVSAASLGLAIISLISNCAYTGAEYNRISMKPSIKIVNELKQKLCINSNDVHEINKLSEICKKMTTVLNGKDAASSTLKDLEDALQETNKQLKTETNKETSNNMQIIKDALLDTFYTRKLNITNDGKENEDKYKIHVVQHLQNHASAKNNVAQILKEGPRNITQESKSAKNVDTVSQIS